MWTASLKANNEPNVFVAHNTQTHTHTQAPSYMIPLTCKEVAIRKHTRTHTERETHKVYHKIEGMRFELRMYLIYD